MLVIGIVAFMSCEKEEQSKETKNKEEVALVFIQNASSINEKVKSYLSNKTEEEVERIKENINNENLALSFLQNANITEEELNLLINTSNEFNRKIEKYSLSDTEIKMMLSSSSTIFTRSNCGVYEAKRDRITRSSGFKLLLCSVAATGGPLPAAACVAVVAVDFSQSMQELEEDYPGCVE